MSILNDLMGGKLSRMKNAKDLSEIESELEEKSGAEVVTLTPAEAVKMITKSADSISKEFISAGTNELRRLDFDGGKLNETLDMQLVLSDVDLGDLEHPLLIESVVTTAIFINFILGSCKHKYYDVTDMWVDFVSKMLFHLLPVFTRDQRLGINDNRQEILTGVMLGSKILGREDVGGVIAAAIMIAHATYLDLFSSREEHKQFSSQGNQDIKPSISLPDMKTFGGLDVAGDA